MEVGQEVDFFWGETDLHHRLEHGDEDELDEADLGGGLGDLLPVHERRHRKSLSLLTVALRTGGVGMGGEGRKEGGVKREKQHRRCCHLLDGGGRV